MEVEILNKILVQVQQIGKDLVDFKQEIREEMYEMFEKQDKKIELLRKEMYEMFKQQDEKVKGLIKDVRMEMYGLFDKNTKEISDEIQELTKFISGKVRQEIKEETKKEIREEIKQKAIKVVEMIKRDEENFVVTAS